MRWSVAQSGRRVSPGRPDRRGVPISITGGRQTDRRWTGTVLTAPPLSLPGGGKRNRQDDDDDADDDE